MQNIIKDTFFILLPNIIRNPDKPAAKRYNLGHRIKTLHGIFLVISVACSTFVTQKVFSHCARNSLFRY